MAQDYPIEAPEARKIVSGVFVTMGVDLKRQAAIAAIAFHHLMTDFIRATSVNHPEAAAFLEPLQVTEEQVGNLKHLVYNIAVRAGETVVTIPELSARVPELVHRIHLTAAPRIGAFQLFTGRAFDFTVTPEEVAAVCTAPPPGRR